MCRHQLQLPFKKLHSHYSSPSGREGPIEGGLSRQTAVMEDQATARDRKVKESEERYSPLTNRPHSSTSLLDERASKLVESLHEGVWLVNREARTVFVHHCLAAMLRYDVDEVIGQSLFPFCDERGAETLRHNLQRRQLGIAEQYDYELVRNDTGPGITGPRHDFPTGSYNEGTRSRVGFDYL